MLTYQHKYSEMKNNNIKKNLTELAEGQTGIIVSITWGKKSSKRMADLGIIPGNEIKVLRKILFKGPVQIELFGSKLVLGRGLASKIEVETK